MSYDKYSYQFTLPDNRIVNGVIYGTYYPQTYEQPSEFVEKEDNFLVLTWEDGTDLTDAEYELELYFKDSDYRCQLQEYAFDMIYEYGRFEYGDPVEYDFDMDHEYVAIEKLFVSYQLQT